MQDIIVFGLGAYWEKKRGSFLEKYHVIVFLDNQIEEGRCVDGVPVHHPNSLRNLPELPIFIMTSMRYLPEMYRQLRFLGIDAHRICFGMNDQPWQNEIESFLHEKGFLIVAEKDGLAIRMGQKMWKFETEDEYKKLVHELKQESDSYMKLLADMPLRPASRHFGMEFGTAIDRYYIEKFLEEHRKVIHGDVLEVAESTYTYRFGSDIANAYKLHVCGEMGCLKGNLVTGEGLQDEMVDCFICTQTLPFIYEAREAVKNICKILKPGGTALITVPGISQIVLGDSERWGDYWRFTKQSLQLLMEEAFDKDKVEIQSWGNVKTAIGFLYGLCQEDLREVDFLYQDEQYQFLITAVCRK